MPRAGTGNPPNWLEMDFSSDHEPAKRKKSHRKRKISSDCDSDPTPPPPVQPRERKAKKSRKVPSPSPRPDMPPTPIVTTATTDAGEPRDIHDLKAKAERLNDAILAHLAAPHQAIPAPTVTLIMSNVAKITGLLTESLLKCSNLEGQLEALTRENAGQRRTFEASAAKAAAPQTQVLTYAQRVGVKSATAARSNLRQDPPSVITIIPKDDKVSTSSDKTKEALFKLVSPRREKIQVKSIRKIQGNGILLQANRSTDIASLLCNEKLRAAGLVVGAPEKRSPRLIVYDVPQAESNESIVKAIVEQNLTGPQQATARKQLRIAFRTGDKAKEKCNVIVEASKDTRDMLIAKERLYIGWNCCRVNDYIAATRCYKCHAYGHTTKHCRATHEVCGHCNKHGHNFKACPNKAKPPTCPSCHRAGKDAGHSVKSNTCPAYIAAINQVLSRTDYGN